MAIVRHIIFALAMCLTLNSLAGVGELPTDQQVRKLVGAAWNFFVEMRGGNVV